MVVGRGRGLGRGRANQDGANQNTVRNPWSTTQPSNAASQVSKSDIVREKMMKAAEKCSNLIDEISSEEDLDDSEVLALSKKTTKQYEDALEGNQEQPFESQFLQDVLQSGGAVTCLVCIETIKRPEAIWNCSQCYCMFHLPCIQKWARESIGRQAVSMDDKVLPQDLMWNCPKCRTEYKQADCPSKYYCYCGKEEDPISDPWTVPHSCGQQCHRHLKPECGHQCLLLCHPGPCPPCPKTVNVKCFCGRDGPSFKRCSMKGWSCKNRCNKQLSCGHHQCEEKCHKGDCPPCQKKSEQRCLCGKNKSIRSCAEPSWSCEKMCGKDVSCGHHVCEQICHSGTCGDCPRSGKRTCPCGKTASQLPCTEDVPSCEDTCMKELQCAMHQCSKRCHYGPCDTCLQVREKTCRCGRRRKEVPCNQVFLCDTKCNNIRSCGRHPCKKKCCNGECSPCEQICNRNLNCRNHKCQSPCHTGPCYPCPLTKSVSCFCGSATMAVPCGRERTVKPPRCKKQCSIPPDCHHELRAKHSCHFGRCPSCKFQCDKKLSSCEHTCQEKCHEHIFDKAATEQNKFRATSKKNGVEVFKTLPCPPCRTPVPMLCFGQHVSEEFPCCEVKPYSCKRACDRKLPCGNHTCQRECHVVKGHPPEGMAKGTQQDVDVKNQTGRNCYQCEELCHKPRQDGCIHDCKLPCHPDDCPNCEVHLKLDCYCKSIQIYVKCCEYNNASVEKKEEMLCCKTRCTKMLTCGHLCPKFCHKGECADERECNGTTKIKCSCGRRKKGFPCHEAKNGMVSLECDERCKEAKAKKTKEQEHIEEEIRNKELLKQKEELEKFERKQQGKRRKQRRITETEEQKSFYEQHFTLILAIGAVLISLGVAAFIMVY